jgi:hypothetical protein
MSIYPLSSSSPLREPRWHAPTVVLRPFNVGRVVVVRKVPVRAGVHEVDRSMLRTVPTRAGVHEVDRSTEGM